MIGILVITHGNFGKELLDSAESILGKQENTNFLHLPSGENIDQLCLNLESILTEMDKGGGVLILTDMLGGTPCNICLRICPGKNIEIASGINLYMLITAFVQRQKSNLKELIEKVVEAGRKNITDIRNFFKK